MTRFENGEYAVMYCGIVTVSGITRGKRTASCTVTDSDGHEHRAEIRRGSGEELLCFTGRNGLCYIVSSDNKKKERQA